MLDDWFFGGVWFFKVEFWGHVGIFKGHLVLGPAQDDLRVGVVGEGGHLGLGGLVVGAPQVVRVSVGLGGRDGRDAGHQFL